MNILLVGACGTGKTWVMKNLIKEKKAEKLCKIGMVYYHSSGPVNIIGKYDNSVFEGSDRLSMAVVKDVPKFLSYNIHRVNIFEGDRFTNQSFLAYADPVVIKILGDGSAGRKKRGTDQSERHIKSISTRVANFKSDHVVEDSAGALKLILKLITDAEKEK